MLVHAVGWCLTGVALFGAGYALIVSVFVLRYGAKNESVATAFGPVTILKPLHGEDPALASALSTFLTQDYPAAVQVVFGAQDPEDPALVIARNLKRDFPGADIEIVVDARLHGSNRKVSNLINMLSAAKHDTFVISDSDISVERNWLQQMIGALANPAVGAVSCLYAGKVYGNAWASLAAMGTTYEFLPNVIAGLSFGLAAPCFGSAIAIRRDTLGAIGGLEAFANQLADDYEMGRAVRAMGRKVVIPGFTVEHASLERDWTELYRHEVRWNRTTHVIDPVGHTLSFITYGVPIALMGVLWSRFSLPADTALLVAFGSRAVLKWALERKFRLAAGPLWALPVRDLLSFVIFLASFFGEDVHWRGSRFAVSQGGLLRSREA